MPIKKRTNTLNFIITKKLNLLLCFMFCVFSMSSQAIDGNSSNLIKYFRAERVTIAYNPLVGNSHGIEIGFDNNDQGNNIIWSKGLIYSTGSATTISGNTTTFDSNQVINQNPNLNYNATEKVWKTTSSPPTYSNIAISETVNADIEGQMRPTSSNPGVDITVPNHQGMPL